jgi:hypothetical protein
MDNVAYDIHICGTGGVWAKLQYSSLASET